MLLWYEGSNEWFIWLFTYYTLFTLYIHFIQRYFHALFSLPSGKPVQTIHWIVNYTHNEWTVRMFQYVSRTRSERLLLKKKKKHLKRVIIWVSQSLIQHRLYCKIPSGEIFIYSYMCLCNLETEAPLIVYKSHVLISQLCLLLVQD